MRQQSVTVKRESDNETTECDSKESDNETTECDSK